MPIIASVPSAHPYVRNLDPVTSWTRGECDRIVRLPDPTPPDATVEGQWWPPRLLDNDWLAAHLDLFDVLHIHFGFESFTPAQLAAVVRTLRAGGKPLVVTVHDLHNPHFGDNAEHEARLDVLIPAADAVITLTAGAAAEITARWAVTATVVPHPHVVPLELLERPRIGTGPFRIGVHAKNLRDNLDPLAVMDTLVEAARRLPDTTVRLDIDDVVFDHFSHWYSPTVGAKLCDYAAFPEVDVRVHPRFDDGELWTYLSEIDVSVLPYRFGTHSGWLEACHDLGTAVVAPDCGFYAEQQPCATFGFGIDRFDTRSLLDAVVDTHGRRSQIAAATRAARTAQREQISAAHSETYRRVIAGTR